MYHLGLSLGLEKGKRESGRRLILESLAISERLSDIQGKGDCYQFLAWLDEADGDRTSAIAHYREALRSFQQVHSPDAEEVCTDLRWLEAEEERDR